MLLIKILRISLIGTACLKRYLMSSYNKKAVLMENKNYNITGVKVNEISGFFKDFISKI